MRALRPGSYSTGDTVQGMPSLSRLKSMMRTKRLWPPPRWRAVTRPVLLRPPALRSETSRWRALGPAVTSELSGNVPWRRPGGVGFEFLTAMANDLVLIAFLQGDGGA